MTTARFMAYVAVMALVTYLIRMLPLVVFKKKIASRFIRSFLFYVPYAVLGAMTLPDILYSTGNTLTAVAGFGVALVLSWKEKPLLVVALSACAAVLALQLILNALGMA